jgi:hypothetical protein
VREDDVFVEGHGSHQPDRGERIAQAITTTSHKVTALVAIAEAVR